MRADDVGASAGRPGGYRTRPLGNARDTAHADSRFHRTYPSRSFPHPRPRCTRMRAHRIKDSPWSPGTSAFCKTRRVAETGLPELDVARVRRWCEQRVPVHVRDQIRVEVDVAPRHLTIVECRPPWRPEAGPEWTRFPIARLRYTKASGRWSLLWRDRHLRFHAYDRLAPSAHVDDLLREIDADPTAIFWG